jgi:hypothetical protein
MQKYDNLQIARLCPWKLEPERRNNENKTYLPDNFFTIFLSDRMTPYTSLASSSNASPVLVVARGAGDGGDCSNGVEGAWESMSLTATTTPVLEERVFLGLPNPE